MKCLSNFRLRAVSRWAIANSSRGLALRWNFAAEELISVGITKREPDMPFIRTGDIVTHYLLEGPENAPVVMFSNSLGTSLAIWDNQAAALKGKYRVLRYDTRGHGLTDAPDAGEAGYTMEMLADDAAALIRALGLKKVHLCGLSIGGMLGQKLAA